MLTIYFLRHGQTDYNQRGIVQGSGVDSSLNETGRAQANAFYEYYQHLNFDAVYASGLQRTHQTLAPWLAKGYSFEAVPAVNELNWGVHEGIVPTPEQKHDFKQMLVHWKEGNLQAKVEGGESPIEAWERSREFFATLPQKHGAGQQILICSHGRQLRVILSNLLGESMTQMEKYNQHNTGLSIVEMAADGSGELKLLNDVRHLE